MHDAPLIGPYNPDEVLAREIDGPRTARQFLSDVSRLADSLPDRPAVLNLLSSRYEFLVGFAAAMLRGQVTLLPQSRAPQTLRRIAGDYPESYCLTNPNEPVEGIESVVPRRQGSLAGWPKRMPHIPLDQVAAIAFTSGSTGQPMPNKKTWGALTAVARATGTRLGLKAGEPAAVVATVPHQHMFGLEASVMLPIVHGLVMHAGRPLFPADIRDVLAEVTGTRLLVTTPLHLRACVAEGLRVPPVGLILSATAPLARSLAQAAERHFQTEVHEIFGFAEAGSVAERRTTADDRWWPLDGVRLAQDHTVWTVQADYLPVPVRVPDRITVDADGQFLVHGREADQINIAGHRVALGDLNQKLLEVEGVQDGVFFLPDEGADLVTRLIACVVAPGKTVEEVQQALRTRIDPVFLPRPLLLVPRLPRNDTGKLPREALLKLAAQQAGGASHDA
ncbi:AMP-binding protein [Nitrospira lenta]|uniref:Acyl-coenzyme A synthetase/AMP-(Fatty) acid ligase n=1 Tax=Nitrospira lenta TaxID=1436998 RepID=A0A330L4M4_9BACT